MHRSFEDIFEVPYASKFRALRSSVRSEVPCASKFRAVTVKSILNLVIRCIKSPLDT